MCKLIGNDTCRHISRDIWLIIIVWNGFFCWEFPPPPPPPDKIPYGKSSHLWDLFPPSSQQKSHMLSQYYIWNLCWRRLAIEGEGLPYIIISPWGSSAIEFLPGGGGGLPRGITHPPPPGEVLLWDFFRGKVCHNVFLQVEGLSYGIISPWGSSAIGFLPGGGGGGGGVCHMVLFPLGKLCYGISSGGRFAIRYSFMWNVCHMVLFPGGQSAMVFVPLSINVWGGSTIEGETLP